jgi:hypothetical protein
MLDIGQQDQEFIAAMPADGIDFANRRREAARSPLQHLIADRMTQRVVDGLEVVQVDEQLERDVRLCAGPWRSHA